ncbi:MAG: SDR family NAD(P)-dependent oxidoreductase [Candidatus Omnitrophota bacterium]|nr:SDR family NAD(P)-dependent oxidoreductase [Candidatus Omnitrophota bacterium]
MKEILVTGAGGFIGSHLCETLVREGYNVRAMIRYNSGNCWGWLDVSPYRKKIEVVSGDIRNYDSVKSSVEGVDTIFHLAALIGIPYSYQTPESYVDTNVKGALNILQAARELKVKKVVCASTSEIYGTAQFIPISEEHAINPQSPYAASKAAADFMALSFYRSFGTPVTIVRPFNTFGPRQSARAIIPTIITQVLGGSKSVKLGFVDSIRDFTFINDTVRGFIAAGESGNTIGEVVNIGSNSEIKIRSLVELIAKLSGKNITIVTENLRKRPDQSEVKRLKADISKAKKLLNWVPKYTLESGLQETIKWFRDLKNLTKYKTEIYNV